MQRNNSIRPNPTNTTSQGSYSAQAEPFLLVLGDDLRFAAQVSKAARKKHLGTSHYWSLASLTQGITQHDATIIMMSIDSWERANTRTFTSLSSLFDDKLLVLLTDTKKMSKNQDGVVRIGIDCDLDEALDYILECFKNRGKKATEVKLPPVPPSKESKQRAVGKKGAQETQKRA